MLPDKNRLDDELIEQISGGLEGDGLIPPGLIDCSSDYSSKTAEFLNFYLCPNCGRTYRAYEERTDGYCPACDPGPLKAEIPTGDIKTTIPIPSDKNKLIKEH